MKRARAAFSPCSVLFLQKSTSQRRLNRLLLFYRGAVTDDACGFRSSARIELGGH